MQQARLGILDEEIGPGLFEYLARNRKLLFPVLCNDEKQLLESRADIGIVGATYLKNKSLIKNLESTGMILFFLDAVKGSSLENHIYPYTPADQLMREIYKNLLKKEIFITGMTGMMFEKEVVAFVSPHSYDLLTGFSFIYSLIMAERKKVLYLNFQYLCGFFAKEDKDVGDLIYEIRKKKAPAGQIVASVVRSLNNLDYVFPVKRQMDLEDLSGEDFVQLIGRLLGEGDYDLIVLDLPLRPEFIHAVYGSCTKMYSLRREGELFFNSQERLKDDLRLYFEDEEVAKLEEIIVPHFKGSFSLDPNLYDTLIESDMGDFIRNNMIDEA